MDYPPPYAYPYGIPPPLGPIRREDPATAYQSMASGAPERLYSVRSQHPRRFHRPQRSESSSPERGRARQDQRPRGRPRRHSLSGDDREAVRQARDRGVRSTSSQNSIERERLRRTDMLQAAESYIARNHATSLRHDSQREGSETPNYATSHKQGESSYGPRLTHSPTPLDQDELDSILPQRGSTVGTKNVNTTQKANLKRPVQYQKPSVVCYP